MAALLGTSLVLVLALAIPRAAFGAEEAGANLPELWVAQKDAGAAASRNAKPAVAPDWGAQKSYVIPALEILGFQFLLNRYDRYHYGCCEFNVNASSIRRNLSNGWVTDSDGFTVNQLGHPYGGSMYHGFARSAGLNYWESLAYTVVGSAAWEIAGETTPPSRNDQITTGFGGSFLGESLFRMANLVLEQ